MKTSRSVSLPDKNHLKTYAQLRKEVRCAIRLGKKRAEAAVEREKVQTAWEIGKLIDRHIFMAKSRTSYGETVVKRLAKDLFISRTELYYFVEFARTYPIVPPTGQLSWSHFRELLAVNEPTKRVMLTQRAQKGNWSSKKLRQVISQLEKSKKGLGKKAPQLRKLSISRKEPGIYRIVRAQKGPYKGKGVVDLGFSSAYRPKSGLKWKVGSFVSGKNYQLISAKDKHIEDLYYYCAYVTKVLDGDTIEAVLDLGFGITSKQVLRLRWLDAPELSLQSGKKAKNFLSKILKKKSKVVIHTEKSDKYDRYLIDLFVGNTYVNMELIKNKHAVAIKL